MSDPVISDASAGSRDDDRAEREIVRAVDAGRIDILYRLGRHYLFLPFAALCLAGVLYKNIAPVGYAIIPLLLQIAATVGTGRLAENYRRAVDPDPRLWAKRFVWASACSGFAWGVGAVVWFDPRSFPAEAFLTVAFLGMTAVEFIARCTYRPAYLAHAALSLGPLCVLLQLQQHTYPMMSSVLVLFFGGVLYSYCEGVAELLGQSLRLRFVNASLIQRLSHEKESAEAARDEAEKSARAKTAFIANMSHEIRTPLNALLGMAQLLERSELDRLQKSQVKVLLEAGRGLKTILDDVITLSRGEDGDAWRDEDCDPAQAARTVLRLLQPRAWEKQLSLNVTIPQVLPRVAADPRRVRQVLLKIVENALKFTEKGGIEIKLEPERHDNGKQFLRFTVVDSGLGIAPEAALHLFEPFTPGDSTYARRNEGPGLGLAVAKRIVEFLGGEIGFESEPGAGSTFWFTVPAIGGFAAERRGAVAIASDAPPPSGLTILIHETDETVRTQIASLLEPFGNRLTIALTLAEALTLAGRVTFDAIIARGEDADMLAASPGVHAPLIAILSGSMRPPAAASATLRWPAGAGQLYGSLRDLLGRGADAVQDLSGHGDNDPAIDASAFAALEKSLGLATLLEILQSYVQTAEELCASLSQASQTESWDDAARIAQDIAGAAGGLGLAALTAAARTFTQKAREGGNRAELSDAARNITDEHERVRTALANLYPDVAA